MDGEIPSEPDSTTAEREVAVREFAVDDDVLCHISRGDQLYLGVVVQVNHVLKKCLVKFLDNTETWCCWAEMKLLSQGEQEVTCVVCKSTQPSLGNQLMVCSCGRGYHQRCHQPHIPPRDQGWKCRICSPRRRDTAKPPVLPAAPVPHQSEHHQQCLQCGRKNAWYRGMLQCRRCRQWLHGSCLKNFNRIILNGDRFYVLVCAGCNRGREMCFRLVLTWADLVHLTLYNLNLVQHSKYHDLDDTIMPFLNRAWNDLQLPPEMTTTPLSERRSHVESALQSCGERFRCGREAKKRVTLWGLRMRGAPRPPPISLPPRGPIDERLQALRKLLLLNIERPEQPLQNGHVNSSRREEEIGRRIADEAAAIIPDNLATDVKVESSTEFHGRGLVKRSVPFPQTDTSNSADARFRSHAVRRAARLLRRRNVKPRRDTPRLSDSEDEALRTLFHDPSRNIADFFSKIEKKDNKKEVRKRPQRNLLEARLNSTESKLYNPQAATTPSESPAKKKLKKGEIVKNVRLKTKQKLVQKTIIETLQPRRWRSEGADGESASSGDERVVPKTVITKRQLSEKDIMVDRHGIVRRRRRHRRPPASLGLLPLKPPPLPPPPPSKDWRDVLFSGPVDMTLVRELLGPLPRVERGDRYQVISRRVLPDGQVEVLLDFPTASS